MNKKILKAFWEYCKQPKNIWDFFDYTIGLLVVGGSIALVMWLVDKAL